MILTRSLACACLAVCFAQQPATARERATPNRPPRDAGEPAPAGADAPCSLQDVVRGASARAEEFVANLEQFTANERVVHRALDKAGRPRGEQVLLFDYLATVRERAPGGLSVEETRNGNASMAVFPTGFATKGLAAFALLFHPYSVKDLDLSCKGLGRWHDQPAWQVHFEQRRSSPHRFFAFRTPRGEKVDVRLKGRAWLTADTYQVVRLEADLAEPMPEVDLDTDHVEIEYGPVEFGGGKAQVWLPQTADIHLAWRHRSFHQRHTFSNFKLFWVEIKQRPVS